MLSFIHKIHRHTTTDLERKTSRNEVAAVLFSGHRLLNGDKVDKQPVFTLVFSSNNENSSVYSVYSSETRRQINLTGESEQQLRDRSCRKKTWCIEWASSQQGRYLCKETRLLFHLAVSTFAVDIRMAHYDVQVVVYLWWNHLLGSLCAPPFGEPSSGVLSPTFRFGGLLTEPPSFDFLACCCRLVCDHVTLVTWEYSE